MKFSHPHADVFVPTGSLSPRDALARVTHLCVAAHQDDIEIMAYAGIADCLALPGKAFGGVLPDCFEQPITGLVAGAFCHHERAVDQPGQRGKRIGSCFALPTSVRMLSVWMSPADGARLFHAALTAEDVGHTIVYGSSANTRLWWDLSSARALGYDPRDDSEPYAEKLIAEQGELDPENIAHAHLGGHFVSDPPIWPY